MSTLLVDGTNIAMFASFGGKVPPEQSTRSAMACIEYAANFMYSPAMQVRVSLDSAAPTFRKQLSPIYKAGRTVNTQPYVDALHSACVKRGWPIVAVEGFEADDLLATMATRCVERQIPCRILSNDSDVLALTGEFVMVYRPKKIREIEVFGAPDVARKYGIAPKHLPLYKALVGEIGDNIIGVAGIGPKTAVAMINDPNTNWKPFDQHLNFTLPLTTLRTDVPL